MSFNTIVGLAYLFLFGAFCGWILELLFWNIVHRNEKEEKIINPGFLNGPYLPIYGFGVSLLYLISMVDINIGFRVVFIFIAMTLLELITGEIFLKFYHVRLWDYTKNRLNYKGLICPLFSFFWTILGLCFYFLIYPYLHSKVLDVLTSTESCFILGSISTIFIIDVIKSFDLLNKIKKELKKDSTKTETNYNDVKAKVNRKFGILHSKGEETKEMIRSHVKKD